jgi:squalene-associated FAD-dependent desaturase
LSARPAAIVVGGGWAGVAAAVSLAGRGARVLLLEARRLWGGRATSWTDPKWDEPVDNGQHVLLGCYARTRALLDRLGTASRVRFQAGLDVSFREMGGRTSRLAAVNGFGPLGLALGLAAWGRLPIGERLALAGVLRAAEPPPDGTVDEWLDQLGAGREARRFFWHPLTEAVINQTPDRAPARLLHAAVERAFRGAGGAGDAAIGLATAGLAELVAPVGDVLAEHEGFAFLGHAAASVGPADGGDGHRVTLEDGRAYEAPHVVLAVPAAEARALLAGRYPGVAAGLEPAAAVPGSPIVTTTLWFEAPVLPASVVCLVAPPAGGGPGFHWAFDRSALLGARAGRHAITLVASAARTLLPLPTAQIVERARAALAAYRLTAAPPVGARVVKEPRATPAYDPETVRARPPVATARAGLAVAGDWTESPLPATIEAAVLSGEQAADAVLSPGARSEPRLLSSRP